MIHDIDIFSMIGDESFPMYENCLVHWSDVYALLSDWCVPLLGEVGHMGRDQSLQAFVSYVKVIWLHPEGSIILWGF